MSGPTIAFPQPDDPDFLAELGGLFMGCKMLFTATSVGLFERLADGPLTAEQLAQAAGVPVRSVQVLTRAMVAMGLLELQGDRIANRRAAQRLTGRNPDDIRAGLRLYEQAILPLWDQFERTVRTGQPAQTTRPSADFGRIFSEGVEAFTYPAAEALAGTYDFSRHRKVLDLCGGTGSYLLPLLRRHASLQATLFELPQVADMAKRRLAHDPNGGRIQITQGDALFDPIPSGHDGVILANTLHLFDPAKAQRILGRVREVVNPGTPLVMPDQWMNDTHTAPFFGTLLAGTYLLLSGDASTYNPKEAEAWLKATGWKLVDQKPLFGVINVLVAEAV